MNTNEQQYEPCPLEEATHAKTATGEVCELDEDKDLIYDSGFDRLTARIDSKDFAYFGITPVRKAEVKPVEFAGVAKEHLDRIVGANGYTRIVPMTIIYVPAEYAGKTFRCVEVQGA